MALLQDLRHGARHLISQPLVSAAAIGSLALGIGLNVAIFSVVNAVLLRGQPLHDPDRLVEIYSGLSQDFPQLTTSYPDFQDIERGADALEGVTGSSFVRGIMASRARGSLVTGESVTANYFDLLGIPLEHRTRFPRRREPRARRLAVIVVSHGLWQRALVARRTSSGRR